MVNCKEEEEGYFYSVLFMDQEREVGGEGYIDCVLLIARRDIEQKVK